MPSYIYLCHIHGEFEEFHSISDDAKLKECPTCRNNQDISTPVQRLISGGSGRGIVELVGRDLIEKTKQDAQKYKQEVYSSEKLYSNVLGESRYQNLQSKIDRSKK